MVTADPHANCVILQNGERVYADLIIGADGWYGVIRKYVTEHEEKEETVDCKKTSLIRVLIPLKKLEADKDLQALTNPAVVSISVYIQFCSWH